MVFAAFTNWTVGVLNGYNVKDGGIPNGIKYGTMGLTTFAGMFKVLANANDVKLHHHITAGQKLAGLFIGVPLLVGTQFCIGHHMGKAIRWSGDTHEQT